MANERYQLPWGPDDPIEIAPGDWKARDNCFVARVGGLMYTVELDDSDQRWVASEDNLDLPLQPADVDMTIPLGRSFTKEEAIAICEMAAARGSCELCEASFLDVQRGLEAGCWSCNDAASMS